MKDSSRQLSPAPQTQRLPPEIWQTILNRVTNPNDLRNAMSVCREWREILKPRMQLGELFPLVLQVPHLLNYLPVPTLLATRRVNSHAKFIVDSTLQRHSIAHFPVNFCNITQNYCAALKKKMEQFEEQFYSFGSEDLCEQFQDRMGQCENRLKNDNPFILGCVQVNLEDSNSFSAYCDQLIAMFQKYGEFVFSLKIEFGRSFSTHVGILLTILEYVPNLRHLKLSTSHYFFISWPFHFEEIYDWIQLIQLPHLVSLNVDKCKTFMGMSAMEYWDDWENWKHRPKTIQGALYDKFYKQLIDTKINNNYKK